MMAAALSTYHAGTQQIVIVEPEGGGSSELARAVSRRYLPFAFTLRVTAERLNALAGSVSVVAAMHPVDGAAVAYVCRDFACRQPVTEAAALLQELETSA